MLFLVTTFLIILLLYHNVTPIEAVIVGFDLRMSGA